MLIPSSYNGPVFIKETPWTSELPEKSWAKGLEKSYKVMAPNLLCLGPKLPHYVFLTEHHDVSYPIADDREKNYAVIRRFCTSIAKHKLLLEKPADFKLTIDDQSGMNSIQAPLGVGGWDDPGVVRRIDCFEKEVDHNYTIIKEALSEGQVDWTKLEDPLRAIRALTLQPPLRNESYRDPATCKKLWEVSRRKIQTRFQEMLKENADLRTLSLMNQLKKNKSYETVFVVLGSSHIFLKESNKNFPEWAFEQVKRIEAYLKEEGETFVILKPQKEK